MGGGNGAAKAEAADPLAACGAEVCDAGKPKKGAFTNGMGKPVGEVG